MTNFEADSTAESLFRTLVAFSFFQRRVDDQDRLLGFPDYLYGGEKANVFYYVSRGCCDPITHKIFIQVFLQVIIYHSHIY